MNTIFAPLPSTDAAGPAPAYPAGVRLADCAAFACVTYSGDGLP